MIATSSNALVSSTVMDEGAGARVRRLFPTRHAQSQDPFVLFDEFFVEPTAGFPSHPHRGFEALTIMEEGSMRHEDSTGTVMTMGPGDVQRFTAGRGIVHSEMPGSARTAHGFQIWINLPAHLKNSAPTYQAVSTDEIPTTDFDGGRGRVIVGPGSPVVLHSPVRIREVHLEKDGVYTPEIPQGETTVVYVYQGAVAVGGNQVASGSALVGTAGLNNIIRSISPSKIILVSGPPIGDPIRLRGSFVD